MVGIIYLGFSKAFNKVPDGRSFLKLEKIRMHRGAVEWEPAERKTITASTAKRTVGLKDRQEPSFSRINFGIFLLSLSPDGQDINRESAYFWDPQWDTNDCP